MIEASGKVFVTCGYLTTYCFHGHLEHIGVFSTHVNYRASRIFNKVFFDSCSRSRNDFYWTRDERKDSCLIRDESQCAMQGMELIWLEGFYETQLCIIYTKVT
jgi:hypothetical protein